MQELGPHVVGDDPGVGADQRADAARQGQRPGGVEPAGEPLPFLAVAEERAGGHENVGLGARGDRFPGAAVQVVAALDVVADRHPVDGRDPGRAGLSRPLPGLGDLGMLSGQPPSRLGDDGADDRADLGGQRRGSVPPLDPAGPRGIGSLDAGRVVVAGAHRRIAVAERGDHTLQRVKRRLVLAAGDRGMGVQPGERPGGQVGQARAAVDQQRLAEHARQLVLPVADLAAVTPAVQHRGRLARGRVDHLGAEDELGQVQPVEHAQVLEITEPGEQVGKRDQERAHGFFCRQRLAVQELPAAGAGQAGPVPACPGPVRLPGVSGVLQDDPGRVRRGPQVDIAAVVMKNVALDSPAPESSATTFGPRRLGREVSSRMNTPT